ncbi:hypothetical protein GCM10017783_11760 [Deinococcus piscis]|uniref:DUF2568 domain-containing protein n=1 Tax=Deinococcus piscis TaxID=394230 RepID=A0ABQ3K376_9DEIO|nr:YrdB family protein [Deinococcus piscis]GHG01186.1 hypothetical protein GCM10017783_11760 [Deinococcus piscis]
MLMLFGTLAFVLEVVAWAALTRWGWSLHPLLALAFPVAFMLVWGMFLSPKAPYGLPPLPKAALQVTLFAVAAYGAGQVWGSSFALVFFAVSLTTILTALALGLHKL